MVTPSSLPSQQPFRPAQDNNASPGETAFVFNFNSPAISHNAGAPVAGQASNQASNGVGGNFGPAADVFQKKNDQPGVSGLNPQSEPALPPSGENSGAPSSPQAGETPADSGMTPNQPAGFDPTIQQQWLQQQTRQSAQPTFGQGMPSPSAFPPVFPQAFRAPMPPFSMQGTTPFPMPGQPPQLAKPPQFPAMPTAFPPASPALQQPPSLPMPAMTAPAIQPPAMPTTGPTQGPTTAPQPAAGEMPGQAQPTAPTQPPAEETTPSADGQNFNTTPISDLNTMIAQPRTPDEKLAAINEIANRQHGDRQTYELLKQEIVMPMQGIPPETASAIRQAALIALGSLNGSPVNTRLAGNELYGIEGISKILNDKNENPLVKASAVAALGYMNRPQDKTIQSLLKKAEKDTNPDVKNAVAQVKSGQANSPSKTGT